MEQQTKQDAKLPRAYRVVDTSTGKLIAWCSNRAEADKSIERWKRRCTRRGVPCAATIEEVKA